MWCVCLPVCHAGAAQQQAQKQAQQRQQQQRQRTGGKEGEGAEGEGKEAPPVVDDRSWLQKNWLIVMAGATMVRLQPQHRHVAVVLLRGFQLSRVQMVDRNKMVQMGDRNLVCIILKVVQST